MKNKLKAKAILRIAGIIALVAVFGFSMVACDDDYGGGYGGSSGGSGGSSTGYLSAPRLTNNSYGSTLSLSWSSVSGARGYIIYFRLGLNGTWSSWDDLDSTSSTSYSENLGQYSGYSFEFKVTAYNSSGESAYSNTVSITIGGGGSTPTPPTPNTSLEGYWEMTGSSGTNSTTGATPGNQAPQIRVSGNTGYLYRSSNSPVWQDDMKKGGVNVGGVYWKDLRNNGNLTWSGSIYTILSKQSSPNVALTHVYSPGTITMSSNGQTITVKYNWSYGDSSGTTTQTYKRL